jgi:hypothetical protein
MSSDSRAHHAGTQHGGGTYVVRSGRGGGSGRDLSRPYIFVFVGHGVRTSFR